MHDLESQFAEAQERLPVLQGRHETAKAGLAARLKQPEMRLDQARSEMDSVMGLAAALYKEAIAGRSLAEAGVATVEVNRTEFESARNYHRQQARRLYWATLIGAGLFLCAVWIVFGNHATPAWLGDLVKNAPPEPAPSTENASESVPVWILAFLLFGGRLSVLLGAGWLVVFFGRLHSRHAQQAISYQDRVAGLDAAKMIIHYGSPAGREETLRRMVSTYLALDDNAFKDEEKATNDPVQEVSRVARTALRARPWRHRK